MSQNFFKHLAKRSTLLSEDAIINDFDKQYVETNEIRVNNTFKEFVLQINQNEPSKQFAKTYLGEAIDFIQQAKEIRNKQNS